LTGIWFDPKAPGDGFTVTQGGSGTVVYFFGYDEPGQRLWLVTDLIQTELFAETTLSVPAYLGETGIFAMPGDAVAPWGTLTITPQNCDAARFELEGLDGSKTFEGIRLADGGRPCDVAIAAPFQELNAQGVDRYLGMFAPSGSQTLGGGITTYAFAREDGPLCFTGSSFAMSTRDGSSDELMIFLQGGGVCGPNACDAVETANPAIPTFGILDAADPNNPAAEFDVGYLPYCDGTFFTGDSDADSDGDGIDDRFFRGIQNLSASLDVIVGRYPAPSRILLIGNSAGGYGVHYALPLVRKVYPRVAIEVVNDSGVGISSPGTLASLSDYWNAGAFYPASCPTCIGEDGHLTDYHSYQLAEDTNIRMGFISSKQDSRIADEGLMIGGPAFEAALLPALAELREAFPDRFRSLVADGDEHTFVIRQIDYPVGDTTVREWLADLLSGGAAWISVSD
ncbi:MAG: pectin acetylesterase-family hydrolase, partial [Pseudomonadota bacterium]